MSNKKGWDPIPIPPHAKAILSRMAIGKAAKLLGVSYVTAWHWRITLGIPSWSRAGAQPMTIPKNAKEVLSQMGVVPAARKLGICRHTALAWRIKLGLPKWMKASQKKKIQKRPKAHSDSLIDAVREVVYSPASKLFENVLVLERVYREMIGAPEQQPIESFTRWLDEKRNGTVFYNGNGTKG